jgi:CRP-like cAMP-binding protein
MTTPSRKLVAAARRRAKTIEDAEVARLALADAIRADAEAGVTQVDIVRATGYTREQVRRIVKGRTT